MAGPRWFFPVEVPPEERATMLEMAVDYFRSYMGGYRGCATGTEYRAVVRELRQVAERRIRLSVGWRRQSLYPRAKVFELYPRQP